MVTIFTFKSQLKAWSHEHCHLWAQPLGILHCVKALGMGTHFGAKAPVCRGGGGVVTGQSDTHMRK